MVASPRIPIELISAGGDVLDMRIIQLELGQLAEKQIGFVAGFEIAHLRQSESVPFSRDKTYRLLLMQPTHLCFLASCLLPPSPHRERLLCISVYLCKTRHMHPHVPMLHVLHCFLDMQNMQDMQCGVWVKTCSPLQRIQHLQTCTT